MKSVNCCSRPWMWVIVAAGAAAMGGASLFLVAAEDPLQAMNRGVALLEEYQYAAAYEVFEGLAGRHPTWEAAHVNLGLAALNQQDKYLPIAERAFQRALELNPQCAPALLSLGILYQHMGRRAEAAGVFRRVVEIDPQDPHALYCLGVIFLEDGKLEEAGPLLEKVTKLQPSFASAHYRLREVYLKSNRRDQMNEALQAFSRLDSAKVAIKWGLKYGEGGKYNLAIRDSVPPGWKGPPAAWAPPGAPAFGAPAVISPRPARLLTRPDGETLAPAMAAGDFDGDGSLEVVLCLEGAPGGGAAGAVVWRRGAGGAWEAAAEIPDAAAALCAAGDLDGDRRLDLVLAGPGTLRFFAGDGGGKLVEKPLTMKDGAGEGAHAGFPLRLYLLDADSDWDLDVLCLRQEKLPDGRINSRLELLNNNGDGSFREIAAESGLGPFAFPAVELIAADLDEDVDPDVIVFDGASGEARAYANDRAWRFRLVAGAGDAAPRAPGVAAAATGDFDGDGKDDLVLAARDGVRFWRNAGGLGFRDDEAFRARFAAAGAEAGSAAPPVPVLGDFQLDLRLGLLLLGGAAGKAPLFIATPAATAAVPVESLGKPEPGAAGPGAGVRGQSAFFALLDPKGPPELVVHEAATGARAFPLAPPAGSRATWLGIELRGPENPIPDKERANVGGVGATVEVRAGGRRAVLQLHGGSGGTARAPGRLYLGLGGAGSVDYARILWPDGVLQAERSLVAGRLHTIPEVERKPSSCPLLFAWTGAEFAFVADFLGVGGLGYLEAPGAYGRPDSTELLVLPALAPRSPGGSGGAELALEVIEPMEECTYLDELKLIVVDHPADVSVVPEELFAVRAPPPGSRLLAFRAPLFAAAARNQRGEDVTEALREADGRLASSFALDRRFPGLAAESHRLELDFGVGIERLLAPAPEGAAEGGKGPGPRPYLLLHGFVEYGYSTSNFAAFQAGKSFRAPTVSVERDGRWVPLREEWGFPAGTPRLMAVDLEGLLRAGDRRLRIETNMDIGWDQAFLADASAEADIAVNEIAAATADLLFRGFPREVRAAAPGLPAHRWEGFQPFASFKAFPGAYTRHGDVRELLREADDRTVVFGPGDGISLRFRADALPPLPAGKRRTFLARVAGWCKDMDLYTACPGRVEPLPFRAMSGYPYAARERPAAPEAWDDYRRAWNTRLVAPARFAGFDGLDAE